MWRHNLHDTHGLNVAQEVIWAGTTKKIWKIFSCYLVLIAVQNTWAHFFMSIMHRRCVLIHKVLCLDKQNFILRLPWTFCDYSSCKKIIFYQTKLPIQYFEQILELTLDSCICRYTNRGGNWSLSLQTVIQKHTWASD